MKPNALFLLFVTLAAFVANGQTVSTRVEWGNDAGTLLFTHDGLLPLSRGSVVDNDGAVLQLGYYNMASAGNEFAGTWVALTGEGTGNLIPSSIGDKGNLPAGQFRISNGFSPTSPVHGNKLPPAGTPLAIRFYDASTIADSDFFNTVSNSQGLWDWETPSNPQSVINLFLTDSGLVWEGGAASAFRTTIPVPEPGVGALLLVSTLVVLSNRSRFVRSRG